MVPIIRERQVEMLALAYKTQMLKRFWDYACTVQRGGEWPTFLLYCKRKICWDYHMSLRKSLNSLYQYFHTKEHVLNTTDRSWRIRLRVHCSLKNRGRNRYDLPAAALHDPLQLFAKGFLLNALVSFLCSEHLEFRRLLEILAASHHTNGSIFL